MKTRSEYPLLLRALLVVTLLVTVLPLPAAAADAGFALSFDGANDFVMLTSTSSMMAPTWTTTKTASLWVRPGDGNVTCVGPESCDAVFGDRPRYWGISRGVRQGVDRLWVWNYDGTSDAVGVEYTPNEWVHVTLVHGGGVLRAYKNGIEVGSIASGTTRQATSSSVLYLGGIINSTTKNWTFHGVIDEVQLWNVARSAAEIQQDMLGVLAGNETGLAAYYRMSNGAGLVLTDDSINDWNGILYDGGSGVPPDGAPPQWVASDAFPGGNGLPVAGNDSATTDEDVAVTVAVLDNDSDPDSDPLTVTAAGPAANGVVTTDGVTVTYTPTLNFNGTDSFPYAISDGNGGTATAQVAVTVLPVNDLPVALDDAATTGAGVAAIVSVLGNDSDPDGNALTVTAAGPAANGAVTTDGVTVTYTPNAGFTGADSFSYTINDGNGGTATATVSVTITGSVSAGNALSFDGINDFVVLSATASMMASTWTTTKTVSLWIRPDGDAEVCLHPVSEWCDAVFGDRPRWWGIARGIRNGEDKIWVFNYDGNSDAIGVDYSPGVWVHVALVHNNGVLRAYKDGVEVGSVPSGPTQQPPAKPILQLGGVINNASRNWTFRGLIDEVQIWNIVRTPAEVQQDMRRALVGDEPGLAAYYAMSNGSGLVLTDDSIYNWNGVLYDGGNGVPPNGTPPQWVTSLIFPSSAR